jgi:Concanavalin A-like lectin/glucanases superfamily
VVRVDLPGQAPGGRAVYFPGNNSNEVETADGNPILFNSGEPYTIALLILWTEDPGNEGIFGSGSADIGNWLWMLSGGRLWGRHANVNSPASGNGPPITAGWHTLVRVWDGQEVRQYVDGLCTNTTAVTATGSEALDEAYVPFFGAFGVAWDDAMVARWSANPLGMLWPETDAAFVVAGGNGQPQSPSPRVPCRSE